MFLPVFFVLLLSNDTSLGQSREMKLPVNTGQSNTEMGVRSLHSVFINGVKALEVKFPNTVKPQPELVGTHLHYSAVMMKGSERL